MKRRSRSLVGLRVAIVAVIVFASALLQLTGLGADSFDGSEIRQINSANYAAQVSTLGRPAVATPASSLSVMITHFALRWGYGEWNLRFPGVLAGTAAVVVLWLLGVATVGREAALYAVAMLAFSATHVRFSRRLGPEVWTELTSLLTVLAFVSTGALMKGRQTGRIVARWVLFALAAVLLCLSGHAGALVIVALAACFTRASFTGAAKGAEAIAGLAAMLVAASTAAYFYIRNPPVVGHSWSLLLPAGRVRELLAGLTPFDTRDPTTVLLVSLGAGAGAIWVALRGGVGCRSPPAGGYRGDPARLRSPR